MHEITLVKNLISVLEKNISDTDIDDVKTIYIEAGRLRYIAPELLKSCFAGMPKSRKLRNAEIEVKILPLKVKCRKCRRESMVEENEFKCGWCPASSVDIVSGNEFILKSIEW